MKCSSQCYSYGCSSAHRAVCSSNLYNLGTLGTVPTAEQMNLLRAAVTTERTARNNHPRYTVAALAGSNVSVGDTVAAQHLTNLKTTINEMVNNTYDNTSASITDTYVAGDLIASTHTSNIIDKINELSVDCICNSDCGANAVCGCYGNCGCNYSDKRLKTEIEYI